MPARVLPVVLVLGALASDAVGRSDLSFGFLVAAVLAAAVSALALFGRLVDVPGIAIRLETVLAGLGLVCVVVAAAVRGQAPEASALPALAASAAVAAIGIYAFQAITALLRPVSGGVRPLPWRQRTTQGSDPRSAQALRRLPNARGEAGGSGSAGRGRGQTPATAGPDSRGSDP